MAGAPETTYAVYVNNPLGERIGDLSAYAVLDGAVAVGTVGALVLTLPEDVDPELIAEDNIIEIWRSPLGGSPYLFLERLWWMRDFLWTGLSAERSVKVICHDQNFLFGSPDGQSGRIISYDEGETQTDKVAAIDDMMKAYVRENAGSLALDATRSLATYLSIAADNSLGPVAHSSGTSRRILLTVLNDLAAMAADLGTYVAWDIVCTQPPHLTTGAKFALEFRTYIGQRGQDHRASSGNPVLIGPDFGNLDEWEKAYLTANEANQIYARGEGISTADAISPAADTVRQTISPFNRREMMVDSQAIDADGLDDDAQSALRAGRPRNTLTGLLIETDGLRFDDEFGFGDYLTAQVRGQSADCRLNALRFQFTRDGGEKLIPILRYDDI